MNIADLAKPGSLALLIFLTKLTIKYPFTKNEKNIAKFASILLSRIIEINIKQMDMAAIEIIMYIFVWVFLLISFL